MNLERIINMAINMLMRRGMSYGIKKAGSMMSGGKNDEPLSPEDRGAQKSAQQQQKAARRAVKMGRRL